MVEWYEAFELPKAGNMMFSGNDSHRKEFIRIGASIFSTIEKELIGYYGGISSDMKILDFGCGIGRVALPFFHAYRKPTNACDPNPNCISYLEKTIPEALPIITHFLPPLPYEDSFFDCVYSISVWTHLPLQLQWPWLREINRVLKVGGVALLTTSSFTALALRRANPTIPGWKGVTDDDLRLEGIMYKRGTAALPGNPGADPEFGYVLHDPQWVAKEWGRLFNYRGCRPDAIAGTQDLNILTKRIHLGPSDLTELV